MEDEYNDDEHLEGKVHGKRKWGKGAKYIFVKRFEKASDAVAWPEKEWITPLTKNGNYGTKGILRMLNMQR